MKNLYKKYEKFKTRGQNGRKNRWIISYADFMTVLFALFIVLLAFSSSSNVRHADVSGLNEIVKDINSSLKSSAVAEVIPASGKVTVRLGEGVLFDEGSAIIKQESKQMLDILAHELKKSTNEIRVEGHSDDTPILSSKYSSNWELSAQRATSIVTYLIENCNIDKKRLSIAAYADNIPVASNENQEGRARNRRVDIVIIN